MVYKGKRKRPSPTAQKKQKSNVDKSSLPENSKKDESVEVNLYNSSFSESTNNSGILNQVRLSRVNCATSVAQFKFNKKRVRMLSACNEVSNDCEGIVYWMFRDQRVQDNWAFLYAQRLALKFECPLYVCYCLVPKFLNSTLRHYKFSLKGLEEVEKECSSLNIPFILLQGEATVALHNFFQKRKIGALVVDFFPLRIISKWISDLKVLLPPNIPICQVDAHNIIPCWVASEKQMYHAFFMRKKMHDKLPEFLTEFPPVIEHLFPPKETFKPVNWKQAESSLKVDRSVKEVQWAVPGTNAGLLMLEEFGLKRLKGYAKYRNDPTKDNQSKLSPWLHFGQISAQRCIIHILKYKNEYPASVDEYVDDVLVKRELADNFCFYNEKYDQVEGSFNWAKDGLWAHVKDVREYIYSRKQFEEAKTHDPLWNAAQTQMVQEGKMHGFLRMYWAKKILEWTRTPEEALAITIYLNDRYELDGQDPLSYVGCMWSICGIHDQAWRDRPIFGKVRNINFKGCQKKFDVNAFIQMYQ